MDRRKIFIVDDSLINLEVARRILQNDYDVYCMRSSQKLFEMLHFINYLPDLILLDIAMPWPNGIATLKMLKNDFSYNKYKDIPIVMLTADAHLETVRECVKGGAAGYVIKPFDAETLHRNIENLLKAENNSDDIDIAWHIDHEEYAE